MTEITVRLSVEDAFKCLRGMDEAMSFIEAFEEFELYDIDDIDDDDPRLRFIPLMEGHYALEKAYREATGKG